MTHLSRICMVGGCSNQNLGWKNKMPLLFSIAVSHSFQTIGALISKLTEGFLLNN